MHVARLLRRFPLLAAVTALAVAGGPYLKAAAAPAVSARAGTAVAPVASGQRCTPNGLACTPYMGWNTYYGLGTQFSEPTIVSVANAMVSRGLRDAGYDYVWIDGGWWDGARDAAGNITVNPARWPHGMAWLTSYIHSLGLKAGIYTDAGATGCGGNGQGSYGHYQQDADQFAAWGFDAVKVDFCGGNHMGLDPATAYAQFSQALRDNSSHRPMLLNICNPFYPGELGPGDPPYDQSAYYSYAFGPSVANSWRTDTDVGFSHDIQWPDVLRNLDADAAHPEAAGPGHWNDPDYLGPELGMTPAEAQAQFTMWAMVAAPLIIGSDVRSLSSHTTAMLTNRAVIAVDQDLLGMQGTRIVQEGSGDVWVKPLANGDRAVAFLNRGAVPLTLSTTAGLAGLPHADRYTMDNLWTHTAAETAGTIRATVAPDSAVLYRVSAGAAPGTPPAVTLSAPDVQAPAKAAAGPVLPPGQGARVSVTLFNDGREPISGAGLSLAAPEQVQVSTQTPQRAAAVPPRGQLAVTWSARAVPGALPGGISLNVTGGYSWGGRRSAGVAATTALTIPYPPPTGTAYLSDQPWLDASSGWEYVTRDASVAGAGPLTLQGHVYQKGLGVASVSRVDFFLGGQCQRLTATAGIDDIVNRVGSQGGTAEFEIYSDGSKIYDSGVVDRTATRSVDVGTTGTQVLTLYVGDAGDGTYNDRADWAGLQLDCAPGLSSQPNGPWPAFVPGAGLTATATSYHPGYLPQYAVDRKLTTFWHSEWQPLAPLPQSITVDLAAPYTVNGLVYLPRQDGGTSGIITGYTISLSTDGTTFTPIDSGSWPADTSTRSARFPATQARYVRLTVTAGVGGYASAGELDFGYIPVS
jgi:alpha-galactosidase